MQKLKKNFFSAISLMLPFFVLLGIPEIIIRLSEIPVNQYEAVFFARDLNSPLLFKKDPFLHWRLTPGRSIEFVGRKTVINSWGFRGPEPSPGRPSILLLGDSTVFGWGVEEEETAAFRLAADLNTGNSKWQVINAGVPGYSSFQVRLMAEKLIKKWKPEYVILMVGNNESWPANHSDQDMYDKTRIAAHIVRMFSVSKYFLWLQDRFQSFFFPKPFYVNTDEEMVPRVSVNEFIRNTKEITAAANIVNAEVILVEPPVNPYWPPKALEILKDWPLIRDRMAAVKGLLEAGRVDEALEKVEAMLEADPGKADLLWMKGILLSKKGMIESGRRVLESAFENHPFPYRAKISYRQALRTFAGRHHLFYIETNQLLRTNHFLDGCHPTPEGHEIIAGAISAAIRENEKRKGAAATGKKSSLPEGNP